MIKWFFVIFSAVYLAITLGYFTIVSLSYMGLAAILQSVSKTSTTPVQRPVIRVANPIKSGQTSAQVQCESWKSLYVNDAKTPYFLQMQEACKKAYGADWKYESD